MKESHAERVESVVKKVKFDTIKLKEKVNSVFGFIKEWVEGIDAEGSGWVKFTVTWTGREYGVATDALWVSIRRLGEMFFETSKWVSNYDGKSLTLVIRENPHYRVGEVFTGQQRTEVREEALISVIEQLSEKIDFEKIFGKGTTLKQMTLDAISKEEDFMREAKKKHHEKWRQEYNERIDKRRELMRLEEAKAK